MIYLFVSIIQLLWFIITVFFSFFIMDADECSASSPMCHENAFCNNTANCFCTSYFCSGFLSDKQLVDPAPVLFFSKPHGLLLLLRFCFFIIDVNECTASSSMCHENAFCNNTLGSYNCSCKPGYYGDGKTCKGKIGRCLHHSSFQSLTGRDVTPRFVSAKLGINPSVT